MKKICSGSLLLVSLVLSLLMSSCRMTTEARIDAYEHSVIVLENQYKDFTPDELEYALELCESQYDELTNGDIELTPNQKGRISNIHGRYHKVLLKIEVYTLANKLFDGESVIQYIKGLLSDFR